MGFFDKMRASFSRFMSGRYGVDQLGNVMLWTGRILSIVGSLAKLGVLTILADVMLVFACGLILALIINWNVDVSSVATKQPETKYEVEGVESNSTQTIDGESELEEMGTVYRDPETGKYYVVEGE